MTGRLLDLFGKPGRSFLWSAICLLAGCGATVAQGTSLAETKCVKQPEDARCFQLRVPENPSLPAGREIGLDIVSFPATSPAPGNRRALFVLFGGPGERATSETAGDIKNWRTLRRDRDIVYVDQRGTGTTPDLYCVRIPAERSLDQDQRDHLWVPRELKDCAARLSKDVDLTQYTTTNAAYDLDLARQALKYDRIDLAGGSYGTRLAQEYLRHFADRVSSATLMGPVPPDNPIPADLARSLDRSLAALVAQCHSEPQCSGKHRAIDAQLKQVRRLLAPRDGDRSVVRIGGDSDGVSAGVVTSYLRSKLYAASAGAEVLSLIETLSSRETAVNVVPAVTKWRKDWANDVPWAMYMSTTCAEDIPFLDVAAERRSARGTLLGTYRVDEQRDGCAVWPRVSVAKSFRAPVKTDVPVLIIVGELDPATPPALGDRVLKGFAKGRLLKIPKTSHYLDDRWGCLEPIVSAFVLQPGTAGLPTECLRDIAATPVGG